MNQDLPFSEACERNKEPILEALREVLPTEGRVLEVGSCTGQHVVFFAPAFPSLAWQPTDCPEYLDGLNARIQREGCPQVCAAIELDVLKVWPAGPFNAVYSSNTAHIMGWDGVCAMFGGVGECLQPGGVFCLYGPFNEGGEFTSSSNAEFDRGLRARDARMGIRDLEALEELAMNNRMILERRFGMPANNQLLVFRMQEVPRDGRL